MAKLGELGKIITGNTPKTSDAQNYRSNDICFVKPSDFTDNEITEIHQSEFYISEYAKDKARVLPTDSILVTCIGIIGKVAINKVPCAFNQQINAIIPERKICDPRYVAYAIQNVQPQMQNTANAAVVPILNKTQFSNIEIPLPSLETQKQIVEFLDKVTSLISLRKQQLAKLDELVKARFVEMFGDSVANTKNFPSATLETVMTVFPQNGLYKPQTDYVQDDTGIPILRIDAFYNGKVTNWNTLKRLICSETEIDRYLLKENDIVINRVNSIEYLGKCAHIVGLKEKTVFESNMMRFHMDEKKVNAVYVTEVLCTEDIYRQILRRAKKSVNQASINQEDVKSLEILVPPLSLQNQFAAFVERVDQQKQTVQQSLEKLELMKKALMQEYFG